MAAMVTVSADADLSNYFDMIPHSDLLKSVARRIVDRHVVRLIKLWLKAPIEERDGDGTRRMSGGKGSTCGTPHHLCALCRGPGLGTSGIGPSRHSAAMQ